MKKNKKKVTKKPLAAAPKKVETPVKKAATPAKKKVVTKKKPVSKTVDKKPSEVKKAIAEIKKLYGKLSYLNTAKVEVLSEISKKETALCERFDYNMAKLQDLAQSQDTAVTVTVTRDPNASYNQINVLPQAIAVANPKLDGSDSLFGLNACAVKY